MANMLQDDANRRSQTNKRSLNGARISLGVLVFSLIGIFVALNVRSHVRLTQLRDEGVEVSGRVEAKHCSNHGELFYSYAAGDQRFSGRGRCSSNCNDAMVGDAVKVTYAESNPRNSECEPLSSKQEFLAGGYIGLFLIGCVAFVLIYRATAPIRPERN